MRFGLGLLLSLTACTSSIGEPIVDLGVTHDGGATADLGARLDAGPLDQGGAPDQGIDAGPGQEDLGVHPDAAEPDAAFDAGPSGTPVLVAVGYGNRRTRTLDGVTWGDDQVVDPNGGDDNNLLRGVGFGDGRFVAVGGGGEGQSWVSDDGQTWHHHVTALRAFVSDAVYGNGRWVAAGGNGLRLYSIDRGESWAGDPGYYAGHFRGLSFGNGVFVAAGHRYGDSTDGLTAVSSDGEVWEVLEHDGLLGFSGVTFGNGVFVATGRGGRLSVSVDGRSWDEINLGGTSYDAPTFTAGEFLVPSAEGLWRGVDGRNFVRIDGFVPGGIVQAFGAFRGVSWQSQRWATPTLGTAWVRTHGDDGPAFTELIVGWVP
jgi:hypothetical protein